MSTEDRLAEVDALWERVYERIASTLADMDIADDDDKEITYLRECVHDIVRDALVTLTWGAACSTLGRNSEQCWHSHRQWTDEGWYCPDCGTSSDVHKPRQFCTSSEVSTRVEADDD